MNAQITPIDHGFRIALRTGYHADVTLEGWIGRIASPLGKANVFTPEEPLPRLVRKIAVAMVVADGDATPAAAARAQRLGWRIAPVLSEQISQLTAELDPLARRARQAVLRVVPALPQYFGEEALYRERYVIRDIATYRAAAIAAAMLGTPNAIPIIKNDPLDLDEPIEVLRNWRALFSCDGRPYRSLDRALMNLPPRIAPYLVANLRLVRIERPITDPLELRFILLHADTMRRSGPRLIIGAHAAVLQRATAPEIRSALDRLGRHLHRPLIDAEDDSLRCLSAYLNDYPQPYAGRLGGLLSRTIEWHRQQFERQREEDTLRLIAAAGGEDQCTARPAIPLPEIEGIRFLANVGEVVREGQRMSHCVANLVEEALFGSVFLFHAEFAGESATVAIDPDGSVRAAHGPRNRLNVAVDWASDQLRGWAGEFPESRLVSPTHVARIRG